MIVIWRMNIGLVGCEREDEIEVEDGLTDAEIEALVLDEVMSRVEYTWEKKS